MNKTTKFLGITAFGLVTYFLYRCSKDKNKDIPSPIGGLGLNIDSETIIDSAMPWVKIPPEYKNPISNSLKKFLRGYVLERSKHSK